MKIVKIIFVVGRNLKFTKGKKRNNEQDKKERGQGIRGKSH